MTFRRAVRFKKEFKLLPPEIKRVAKAKFALFSRNWRHPSLRVHKLEGLLGTVTRFSISGSRIVTAFCSFLMVMSWSLSQLVRTVSYLNE
jgi:hypothetical protein